MTLVIFSLFFGKTTFSETLYNAEYKNESIAHILKELAVHFQLNAVFIKLDQHKTSFHFHDCKLELCIRNFMHGPQFHFFPADNFLLFVPVTDYKENFQEMKLMIEDYTRKKDFPLVSFSYEKVPLFLLLAKIITILNSPLRLSNKIQGNVSLHVKNINAFELLYYLIYFYHLEIITDHGIQKIVPK